MGMVDFSLSDIGSLFTDAREALTGKKILDPERMAELDIKLAKVQQAMNLGQISVNKEEAKHSSIFVAGWRPFIGWVCGSALAYAYILQPIAEWIIALSGNTIDMPILNTDTLYQLVLAMLGMAGLRTFEKIKDVSRDRIKE